MEQTQINRIVEAALLASPQPLTLAQLTALFGEDSPPPTDSIERALQQLANANEDRGVQLIEVASGFRYQVAHELQPWVARLWSERPARYSRALLETLALIAYRQPITRGEIEQIRGVAVSSNIIKTLEEREWVRVVGHRDVPGRPAVFGTTRGCLDYFGLRSLDQLPALTDLQDLPDLAPELPLEPVALANDKRSADVAEAHAMPADAFAAPAPDTAESIVSTPLHPESPAADDPIVSESSAEPVPSAQTPASIDPSEAPNDAAPRTLAE